MRRHDRSIQPNNAFPHAPFLRLTPLTRDLPTTYHQTLRGCYYIAQQCVGPISSGFAPLAPQILSELLLILLLSCCPGSHPRTCQKLLGVDLFSRWICVISASILSASLSSKGRGGDAYGGAVEQSGNCAKLGHYQRLSVQGLVDPIQIGLSERFPIKHDRILPSSSRVYDSE